MTETKRRITREGREAMAQAGRTVGTRNLLAWREAHDADAQRAREETKEFERLLREEMGTDASAIGLGLIKSAVASFVVVAEVSKRLTRASGRIGRIKALHEVIVEAQRNLFRVLKALQIDSDSPAAQDLRRARILERVNAEITESRANDPRTKGVIDG